ncbi:MAG: hypothetical protein AAF203_02000 [Pseudomonadota bacterium]
MIRSFYRLCFPLLLTLFIALATQSSLAEDSFDLRLVKVQGVYGLTKIVGLATDLQYISLECVDNWRTSGLGIEFFEALKIMPFRAQPGFSYLGHGRRNQLVKVTTFEFPDCRDRLSSLVEGLIVDEGQKMISISSVDEKFEIYLEDIDEADQLALRLKMQSSIREKALQAIENSR